MARNLFVTFKWGQQRLSGRSLVASSALLSSTDFVRGRRIHVTQRTGLRVVCDFNVALGLALKTTTGLNTVQVTVDVDLKRCVQTRCRAESLPTSCAAIRRRRLTFPSSLM